MGMAIAAILDKFMDKYGKILSIENGYIDITECFYSSHLDSYKAPKSFGDLRKNRAFLYVIYGAPFIEKYRKDKSGRLIYRNEKFIPVEFGLEHRVLACLCLKETKNVSLHEIYDAIYPNNRTEVQGFRAWALNNIIKKIKSAYPKFNIKKDSAFIFAGKENEIVAKIELNKIWFGQFLKYGGGALSKMEEDEITLIKEIFGDKRTNYKESAYKLGSKILEETAEFLERKITLA